MTSAKTQMPPAWSFSPQDCEAMVSAGIIAEGEQAAVLSGTRRFNVDEYLAMEPAGVLHEDDRVELMDGEIIVMAPIGPPHEEGTDWLTMGLAPALAGRAMVRVQGSVQLNDHTMSQPDVIVYPLRPRGSGRLTAEEVYFVIEVSDSTLSYDRGPKLARYAEAGIPEVWIANLRAREVAVHANPSGSGYATVRTYRAGDSITLRDFPDVTLAVDDFMPPAAG